MGLVFVGSFPLPVVSSSSGFSPSNKDSLWLPGTGTLDLYFLNRTVVGAPVEAFSIMYISLQRTKAVTRPLERQSGASILKKIGLIWLIALAVELPQVWKYDENGPGYRKCLNGNWWQNKSRNGRSLIFVFFPERGNTRWRNGIYTIRYHSLRGCHHTSADFHATGVDPSGRTAPISGWNEGKKKS